MATAKRSPPDPRTLETSLRAACPDVGEATLRDFLTRLDPDYFSHFDPEEVCRHMKMAEGLTESRPYQVYFERRDESRLRIGIVAFDYFSQFSALCGLVASFGLDILSGHSYTYSKSAPSAPSRRPAGRPGRRPAGASRAKIVDAFEVRVRAASGFGSEAEAQLVSELDVLESLLAAGQPEQLRERLNRRLVERLARDTSAVGGVPRPAEVRFDDEASERWTVMDVHSRDSPGFLYAFSNALAMRGVYIHRVRIESLGDEVSDRFYISDRHGGKIDGEHERNALARAVVLIEQFTHFLRRAPDPARAVRYFDQFLDKVLERDPGISHFRIVTRREGLDLLAQLLGSSEFLWEELLRNNFEALMPVFGRLGQDEEAWGREQLAGDLDARLATAAHREQRRRVLNDFKDGEMLLIVLQQMRAPGDLTRFSERLTELAEVVLERALRLATAQLAEQYGRPVSSGGDDCPLAICALGKLGGREIGHASDVELVFIHGSSGTTDGPQPISTDLYFEYLVREFVELIEARQEGAFHVDLRLRPHGKAGPMAIPFELWKTYYSPSGEAVPFERQALTKLRVVAGDEALGREVLAHRDRFVYSGEPWDMEQALHLRQRQASELVEPGRVNAKYSPGGLIDVEYAVQYLQVIHGGERPELRTPTTLIGLRALREAGLFSEDEEARLAAAYSFLRRLIDAMRMVKNEASDLVLPAPDAPEFGYLARRMGYRDADWARSSARLAENITREMETVRELFSERFGVVESANRGGR